jgi:hypothetical protein
MAETLFFRGRLYSIPATEFHDPTWTRTERRTCITYVALQTPTTAETYTIALQIARMAIYIARGCTYPAKWTTAIAALHASVAA